MPTVKMEKVETIRDNMSSGEWSIPKFQRNEVWSIPQQVLFINSLLIGMRVGMIMIGVTGTIKNLLDGRQRASTILRFLNDEFVYSYKQVKGKLERSVLLPELLGKKFSEFPEDMKHRILKSTIVVEYVEFDSIKESNTQFRLLNTKSVKLNKGENIHSIFEERTRSALLKIAGWTFFIDNLPKEKGKRFGNLEFVVDLIQTYDKLPGSCVDSKEIMSWAENHSKIGMRKIGEYRSAIEEAASDVSSIFFTERCKFWQSPSNLFALMTAIMYLQHDGWKLEDREKKTALCENLIEFSVKVAEPDNHDDYEAKEWAAKKNDGLGKPPKRNLRRRILCNILKKYYTK